MSQETGRQSLQMLMELGRFTSYCVAFLPIFSSFHFLLNTYTYLSHIECPLFVIARMNSRFYYTFISSLQRIAAVVYGAYVWTAYTKEGSNIPPQRLVWTTHSSAYQPGTQNWCAITSSSSGDKLGLLAENGPLYIGTSNLVGAFVFSFLIK